MYRKTYAEIDLSGVYQNVKVLVNYLKKYQYHIGVVKADCYGHEAKKIVDKIIEGGCNYLAVATLEEALEIRKIQKNISILCLGVVNNDDLKVCQKNDITITISNLTHLKSLDLHLLKNNKIHLKINTGMNRLGISSEEEMNEVLSVLKFQNITIEGIYTHIFNDASQSDTIKQIQCFENITKNVNLKKIPIVHFGASAYSLNYPKLDYVNGCRFGIAMYGLIECSLNLKSTFSLYSEIIQINEVEKGTVGYNGAYKVNNQEKIAVVPIGYADGIIRKNTGRDVFIKGNRYPILGNICMDMLFVKVDDNVSIGDRVTIIKDNDHINEIAKHLDTINYEVICSIGKRIPRIYK